MNIYRRRGEDKDESLFDFTGVDKGIDDVDDAFFYKLDAFGPDLIYILRMFCFFSFVLLL